MPSGHAARMVRPYLALLALLSSAGFAVAQPASLANELVGTWTLVAVDNLLPDGGRVHLYRPEPQGILTFDAEGRYALQIYRAERPKFASGDKSKATAEENRAAMLGSNAHFGRYVVNAADRSITFHIEHASFPNWNGIDQKRSFSLAGGLRSYTVPAPTSGTSVTGEVVWARAN